MEAPWTATRVAARTAKPRVNCIVKELRSVVAKTQESMAGELLLLNFYVFTLLLYVQAHTGTPYLGTTR